MSYCKEIGGYFELECGHNAPYHADALKFNSARNALRFIVRANQIKEMFVPYYTCPVVWQALKAENVKLTYYCINQNLEPDLNDVPEDKFILVNNYFGIKNSHIRKISSEHKNLIEDNAQAFYAQKCGIAAFYSPRKFFGLPDGGLAVCNKSSEDNFEQATSYNLCSHLLKRHDLSASEAYADFQKNDDYLLNQPVQKMSELTQALMGNIDYKYVQQKRLQNFKILHDALKNNNELKFALTPDDVPMVYPFLTDKNGLRKSLIANKIYVATYWPGSNQDKKKRIKKTYSKDL